MKSITVDSSKDQYIISIDKDLVDRDVLFQFIENLRQEFLAQKVDFDIEIEQLSEEIKQEWWAKNKDRFIPRDE